jgi:hypothetical protein
MVRRSTWILLGLFVLLVGFAWLFQRYQTNKTKNTATATPSVTPVNLYDLTDAQIKGINITDAAGSNIDLYRDPTSSNWAITGVPVDQADSSQIESINKQLISSPVKETFTQTLALDSVGLITPAYTITMTTMDGTQFITYVGSQNAVGDSYYIRVNFGEVVLVDKVTIDDVLNLLTKPPLLPTATPEMTPTETIAPTELGVQGTPTP